MKNVVPLTWKGLEANPPDTDVAAAPEERTDDVVDLIWEVPLPVVVPVPLRTVRVVPPDPSSVTCMIISAETVALAPKRTSNARIIERNVRGYMLVG